MRQGSRAGKRWRAILTATVILAVAGPAGGNEYPWTAHIRAVDNALAHGDVAHALHAWREAYAAAVGSLRWEGMIEVGDAYLRIGEVSGLRQVAVAKGRNSYLAALFRARQQESLEGVLRTAEAFVQLGDRDMVEQCLKMARDLASRHSDSRAEPRLRALAARLAEWPAGAPQP